MGSLPNLVVDLHGILQLYSDGSVFRSSKIDFRNISAVENPSVEWKDILYNHQHNLYLRLYKPIQSSSTSSSSPNPSRLPVLYYLHGGGFCLGSRTWPNFHNCCQKLAAELNAFVISPDYRLAPENRLPAAIDDVVSAVEWLQGQALSEKSDAWLSGDTVVDFDKTFILGDSSGGNIAHQLAVKFGPDCGLLKPVRVRGYVMMAPFFGGVVRTISEAEGPGEELLNLEILDRFWRLSLPEGETRDHPLVNPFSSSSPSLESVKLSPILVIVGGNEIMKDRIEDYVNRLKEMKKDIEYVKIEGKQHGFFTNEPASEVSENVLKAIQKFMFNNSKN